MSWLENERHWFLLAVIFYGFSMLYSVFLWRNGFRHHNRINYLLYVAAFGLHTVAMVKRGFTLAHCPVNNLYEAMIFVDWTIVATYLVLGLWSRLRFLGAFASPIVFCIGVFALMPGLDPPYGDKPVFANGWWSLHASLILLAYGAFGLSSIAAAMYLNQEHDLKFHKFRAVFSLLPPIQRLELVAGRCLLIGFILLTLGLIIGGINVRHNPPKVPVTKDAKVLWSIFVWFVYLALIVMRWRFAQGGRKFAYGAVASFAFILLTFWGFNLLSGIHHP